ncbi:uncharacterized protein LOC132107016 [Carassius carassius]|uniref:uncharacterized protein LOC132107016 n=1 Tax=Carassius carassius TaxID=217509 RepID=UPI0028693EEF|nr:uncharacterized protein LOC132107016 [Carassius carassius]
MVKNMLNQKLSGGCSDSSVYLHVSLLNEQSSAYSSEPSESQWVEEIQESEEEQEASVTTQNKDNDVHSKVWQSKNCNRSKRVYDCPVCHKRFGSPSELKRHCLIHTNQRPFQCSICCRAFRERSHLKVHIRTHTNPVKRRTRSLQSYKDKSVTCYLASKSKLKPSPKQPSAQDDTKSTDKEMSTAHQDQNMVTENMVSQKICGDCNDSCLQFPDSFLNEGGWDCHTGWSSAYFSKPSEGQWMDENQKTGEQQEANLTTQNKDNDVHSKVWQSKNCNRSKRVYDCPVCHKRFGSPSELKRHCLIHTNQRPFQCSICCRAFRERSHLKVHIRTHTNPVKRRTRSLQSYKDNSVTCYLASKSKLKPSPKQPSAQDDTKSTDKEMSTAHQDKNMVTENMVSQKICGDCNDSCLQFPDSFLNEGGWDCHTGWSSAYFSKPSEGQWMDENQKTGEQQEANLTTQNKDNDVHSKVWQSKNCNRSKRVYYCPVCHKKFDAPSELKRHCLIHTNQRPFQCSICCRAFRECSHLKVHIRTHDVPVKRRTPSLQSYRDNIVSCNRASKSQPSPKFLTAHNDTTSTNKQKSTVQQDQNVLTEDMLSQKICGDYNDSGVHFPDSLLIEGGWDRHTGQSSAYSSKHSEGQWMEEIQESEEEQEANLTTQNEDNNVNEKALQSRNSNVNKRVYDCPVCRKRFGAPSELKRHCLIHTNQRPFQCSICCRAFRERSHLKGHFSTHNISEKRRAPSLQSYRVNSVPCNQASKSRLKSSPKQTTAQDDTKSTDKEKSTVHQDEKMVIENMASQIISGDCSESDACLQDSLLNKKGWDRHTGLSSLYFSKPSEGQWMEEIKESEEKQESSVSTQSEDDVNVMVLQSKKYDGNKRVYDCPVCHKRFGSPSELKRHCLIHTNQRPFQCSICCRAFRERSHLKLHIRTHINPVKRRTRSLQSYKDNSVPCYPTSKSRLKPSPKYLTVQNNASSTEKQQSAVHQYENIVTEIVACQIISGNCSESDGYLEDSFLNKEGLDLHTGLSSAYSPKPLESQWMEEIQEASVTTQNEDNGVNSKVWQSKNCNRSKRVYDCPVCHKRFGAPSELKRHCLIHTNQRPFQCSICCRAFRERSHLKVHIRTHDVPVKRRTPSLQSYRDNIVSCNRASKSQPSPKFLTAHNDATSTNKQKSTVQQDQNVLTEDMLSQKICGDYNDSGVHFPDSLLIEGGWDRHTGQSSAYSSKHSEGQWMEEIQESEEEQEANLTTQNEDNNVNEKALQSRNSNVNKRVYDCPVCRKRFGAPSELKRHCLIHTNQRPFQCSICCRAFRERSHLKGHFSTHNISEKRRAPSLQSYRVNSVPCNQASKSRLKSSPKQTTAQDDTKSTDKEKSTVHQDEKMVIENMASQIISGDCSESDACLQDSLLNKKGWDRHTGLSSLYFSKPSEGQWMEEIKESEEKQESSVSTQSEDDVNVMVLQSKKYDGNKRVYDCPVCHKRFGSPSELKRHCLIHTNQRPFQCSICCRAFRERSHLKVHIRTHINPVKRRTRSLQSYKDNSVPCYQTSKSRLKPSPKYLTVQNNASSTEKQQSAFHQNENIVTEIVACQIISGDCSESGGYLEDSLLNKEGLDLHTGLSSAYSPKPLESQWIEDIQEARVTTQNEDNGVNSKVWQSKNCNRSKRVYDCPVCHKRFGAPSELKRHCLIHTNQRPFQCSICCRAFRERSHLKVHIRTHTNPVKRRTPSLQSYRDNIMSCNRASKSQPSPKFLTAYNDTTSTNKQKSTVQQDQNVLTEDMVSQKIFGDYNDPGVHSPDSLLIEGGWDRHTGQSTAYSSRPSEGQWMEEIQESEEEQEANLLTQNEDNDVNEKALQSRNLNVNKRVYDCPVCHKKFDAPSELKRHCLIHTNQRPFQCSICCRAFRERSHLKVHIRTHTNPVKRRTRSLQSYKDNSVPCYQTSKSRLKPSPKYLTVQNNASSTEKQQSEVHQYENMVTEIVGSQIISGDCSESDAYLEDSVLDKEGLDLQIGLSSAYFSSNSEGHWMEEIQESEEEQEASVTTQNEDDDLDSKVWQSNNCNISKRVYYCPVCRKRFGAPSELKRHCLIHTNQRPFQCSICCRAFRERSHLKVHIRTHDVPVKRRTPSLQSYRDNIVSCNRASKSKLKPSPKFLTAHNDTTSTNKQKSTVQQDQNVLTEDMLSQKICGDYNDSSVYLSKSTSPLENVENSKSVLGLTHKTDILLDGKKASDIVPFGRVSDCPPKTDSFLRHCAPESRTEEKWAHYMDDVEDVFVDSETVVTQCVPDSHEPSSCQYQQKPDVPRIPEVVVELEDFEDPGECFIKTPHDLPICPYCSQSFRTVRNLYAHNCTNRYTEGEVKKSHQCDICFKFFSAPSKLKRHYVTHTGQRPFLCTQCQKSFTQAHHLKTHMLSHR